MKRAATTQAGKMLDAIEADLRLIVADIEADARFRYKPALVEINAPLALIQVDMKAKHCVATTLLKRYWP